MPHKIEFAPSAAREFNKLPRSVQITLKQEIDSLSTNPYPDKVEPITDIAHCYRIRKGDYRIIYVVYDSRLIVLVTRIGDRKDVYKKMSPALKKIISQWERTQP